MSIELPDRDGDGYLRSTQDWTQEVGAAMAKADGVTLGDEHWDHITQARAYYDDTQTVPPIRKFIKYVNGDKKAMFSLWKTGPMKPITKYGGLPKPTGCV